LVLISFYFSNQFKLVLQFLFFIDKTNILYKLITTIINFISEYLIIKAHYKGRVNH